MAALKLEQHGFGKAGKHLALRPLHLGDGHHRPADVTAELNDSTLENVDATTGNLRIKVLGVAPINHQTGLLEAVLIDLKGAGHACHPDDHIGLRQGLIERQNPATAQFLLKIKQRLLLTRHQQELTNSGACLQPTADGGADITSGTNDGHLGFAEIDPETWSVVLHLTADHPGRVGVSGGEPLPIQGGAPHRLVLEQVEILENDRGEATQGSDVDALLLSEFHGVEHLAPGRLETAQHLGNKAGVDVGTLDGRAHGTGDFHVLNELRRCAAPNIQITVGDVIEPEFHRLAASSLKTR